MAVKQPNKNQQTLAYQVHLQFSIFFSTRSSFNEAEVNSVCQGAGILFSQGEIV